MSALKILIHELARGGGQTTYATLMKRHGDDYGLDDFAHAVWRARRRGIVVDDGGKGKPIIARGDCPCCGRRLSKEER